jgi:hyperosmotically inducible protein
MHARIVATTLLLVLVVTANAARAQDRRDGRLADDVVSALSTHPQLTIFDDVKGLVQDGVVTLTGKVTAEYKKQDVGRIVGRIEGVRQLRNHVGVLPASPFDDELRYRASRAIYTNPAFWSYASMARPPIHVIVENGHVTLTGVVASDVERGLARSLATGLGESSVTNELRIDIEPAGRGVSRATANPRFEGPS